MAELTCFPGLAVILVIVVGSLCTSSALGCFGSLRERGNVNSITISVLVFFFYDGYTSLYVAVIGLRTRCGAMALFLRSRALCDLIGVTFRYGICVDVS